VASTAPSREGSTFSRIPSLVVMGLARTKTEAEIGDVEELFAGVLQGEHGEQLRAQLATKNPGRTEEEVEDAIQTACKRFFDRAEGISTPAQVYTWIRTTAHRLLGKEAPLHRFHECPMDPGALTLQEIEAPDPGPEERALSHESRADLSELVEEVSSSLSERQREVLALYGAGFKRPEIAARLGISERIVKRDLLDIVSKARDALAERAGGGCERGEPLVMRFACGLATSAEAAHARLHLDQCQRCELFSERLSVWREKVGALLPLPAAAEGASPGVLARLAHRTTEAVSTLKQQAIDGGTQLKQHAATAYYRAVDPTPLAGAHPGAVAAVVAGCVTLGSGATYCAQQGVNPLGAAAGLIAGTQESKPKPSPPPEPEEPASTTPPPVSEEPPPATTEEAEAPPVEAEPTTTPEPAPPPPPEQTFEPASPDYVGTSEASSGSQGSESAPQERPAPVSGSGPQFGGP
jgi:RNA polymerase sigma factor (sigma-70 family)